MVLTPLHYVPSAIAALLTLALLIFGKRRAHRWLGIALILAGALGFFGYISSGNLRLSYEELLSLPAYSEVAYMPCVEGWGFYAKWTGFRATDLLNLSGLRPAARYVVFRTEEGYSTGLPLDYLKENRILMAYGINDITLPPERGYPLQLVARGRYGYKWAKWITDVEVTDIEIEGYWESRGYSNSAKVGEFPFG